MPAEPSAKASRRSLCIGPYAVEAPLALGSLGSAYRATDQGSGRRVALKVLPPELAGNPAARERFQREAKRAVKVRSPHLVNVVDFGDASGTWYLALELVEGDTLAEFIRRQGALDGEAGREVLVQAARALSLLHRQGVVPRDLSADNFRVTSGPDARGRIGVKLLDLGLLRPADDESPADVRVALGALGATACFALSGRGGKPDLGSLAGDVTDELRGVLRRLLMPRPEERYQTPAALLQALGEEEPVSMEELVAPVEEVASFEEAAPGGNPLAALADEGDEPAPPPRKVPTAPKPMRRRDDPEPDDGATAPARRRGRDEADDEGDKDDKPAPAAKPVKAGGSRKVLILGAAAFAGVLIVGGAVAYFLSSTPEHKPRTPANPPVVLSAGKDNADAAKPVETGKEKPAEAAKEVAAEPKEADPKKEAEQPPPLPPPPPLYNPVEPIVAEKVAQEFTGPFATRAQVPADTPVFLVARVPPANAKPGTWFESIGAACAAIPEGKWGNVRVCDDGPLFEGPIHLTGRNVLIEAGRGFAPLVVWDAARAHAELKPGKPPAEQPKENVPAFLTVEKGIVHLGNLHVAVGWPERATGSPCLVRVRGGDLLAWESTFSAAGKPHGPMAAVRFEGGAGHTCWLRQCFTRGAHLTALDVPAPGSEVLLDSSLLVGGEAPLLTVAGGSLAEGVTTLRAVRCTLAARDTVLQVRPSAKAAADPQLHWMGWDVLAWRTAEDSGGTLVSLPKEAGGKAMTWRAVNCLYAGWDTLLAGRDRLAGADTEAWHAYWKVAEGDVSLPHAWVRRMPADPAEALAGYYTTETPPGAPAHSPVTFRATWGPGLLGCDVSQLPWARPRWLDLTAERARPADIETMQPDVFPAIEEGKDLLYHGERLDLDAPDMDVGKHLREAQQKQKLAPLVVLHLRGTGKRKTSPLRVENANLFLYVEPPAAGADPLVLEPDTTVPQDGNALIEVTGGNLWINGADVRCPDYKTALLPHYLVRVVHGNLFLSGTRLQGPLAHPPDTYWGLVRVDGRCVAEREWMCKLSVNQSVLISAKIGLHLAGAGLRVDLKQSLVVSSDWAVEVQTALPNQVVPGNPTREGTPMAKQFLYGEAKLNTEITAEHCTFAAREAVLYLDDLLTKTDAPPYLWPVVADPVVVQMKDCAFLNPFANGEAKSAAALLCYRDLALERGLVCWQGEGNVYDKRLHAYVTRVGADNRPQRAEKAQDHATWERLWGPEESKALLDVPLKHTLDLEKPALDQFALPLKEKEKPGADLTKLLAPRNAKPATP